MLCRICGAELRVLNENTCYSCKEAERDAQMVAKIQETVEYLCDYLNSSVAKPHKVAEAFYGTLVKQHRYLQGSFMDAMHKFLKAYSDAPSDDRNRWATKWAAEAVKTP